MVTSTYYCWVEVFSLSNQEAITVAFNEMFLRRNWCLWAATFWPGLAIWSTGGLWNMQGVTYLQTLELYTPFHPQWNRLVKRLNKTLLNMLAIWAINHPFDWKHHSLHGLHQQWSIFYMLHPILSSLVVRHDYLWTSCTDLHNSKFSHMARMSSCFKTN